jgi:hypothetical protein
VVKLKRNSHEIIIIIIIKLKNKMQAIGSVAVTVLRYSFGIINWHQEEIQKLYKKKYQHHSITQEQKLIIFVFPEKREEED